MFWHVEGVKTQYKGTIEMDGVIYDVIPEKSYADKNLGADFTRPWLWILSYNLTSLLLDKNWKTLPLWMGDGKSKAFDISLPRKLLICFYNEKPKMNIIFLNFEIVQISNLVLKKEKKKINGLLILSILIVRLN